MNITIAVTPDIVYHALTNRYALTQWLCDDAIVRAQPGGAIVLVWGADQTACGQFSALEPDHRVAYHINDADITWDLSPDGDDATAVELTVSSDDERWGQSLELLKHLLETGLDLRALRRPLLGVIPGVFDAAKAGELGVPVKQGMLVDGLVDGTPAAESGLQHDDVLVTMDGAPLAPFPAYVATMQQHQAGDVVEIEYYRGPMKHTVSFALASRPQPDIPATAREVVRKTRMSYDKLMADLRIAIDGVPETKLAQAPAEGEWSVNEVLAHLIFCERWIHLTLWGMEGGEGNIPYTGNHPMQRAGILLAHMSGAELLEQFKRELDTTVGILMKVGKLPRKYDYVNAVQLVQAFLPHSQGHLQQIKDSVAALA